MSFNPNINSIKGQYSVLATIPTTAQYGLLSVGSQGFTGGGGSNFNGSPNGTGIALNVPSGVNGLDIQVAGAAGIAIQGSAIYSPVTDKTTPLSNENYFSFSLLKSSSSITLTPRNGNGVTLSPSAGQTRFDVGGSSSGIGNAGVNQIAISTAASGGAVTRTLWFADGHSIFSTAPVGTVQYGTVNIGSGGFAGAGGGFSGLAAGTSIAINEITGFAGDLINAQVNGITNFKIAAGGNVTATGIILAPNLTATTVLRLNNANSTIIGSGAGNTTFQNAAWNAGTVGWSFGVINVTNLAPTSGTTYGIDMPINFRPVSGNGDFVTMNINPIINQTLTSTGNTWGLKINPTLTSSLGTWTPLEVVSGVSIFGGGINVPANISSTLNGVVIGGGSGNRTLVTPDANPAIINLGFTNTGLTFTTHTNYTAGIGFTFNALPNTTQDLFAIQKAGTAVLKTTNAGDLLQAIGKKLIIPSGTNARQGIATLSSGTVTISTTAVSANSQVYVVYNTPSGTLASGLAVPVGSITAGTSFVINSVTTAGIVNTFDNSTVNWVILDNA